MTLSGATGRSIKGADAFISDVLDESLPIQLRGLWGQITGRLHRWTQAVSRDGGRS